MHIFSSPRPILGGGVGGGVMLYTWWQRQRQDLVKVFVADPVSKLFHQICMDQASGTIYGPERLGYWIWAMNFRCWRGFRCLEQVKVYGADSLWWQYLGYHRPQLHQTCLDGASYDSYALYMLRCWIWTKGFGCWMRLRC